MRLGKCQVSRKVMVLLWPGDKAVETASEAMGASWPSLRRFSSWPSWEKSSQKSNSEVPQPALSQAVRALSPLRAVVLSASEPHCADRWSTSRESKKRPLMFLRWRKRLRFLSAAPSVPSLPTKLGREPQTATSILFCVGLCRW